MKITVRLFLAEKGVQANSKAWHNALQSEHIQRMAIAHSVHENASDFSDGHSCGNLRKTATAADSVTTKQSDDSVLESQPVKSDAAVSCEDQVTATNRKSKRGISSETGADAEHSAAEAEAQKREVDQPWSS